MCDATETKPVMRDARLVSVFLFFGVRRLHTVFRGNDVQQETQNGNDKKKLVLMP